MQFILWDENHPGIKIVTGKPSHPADFFDRCNTALNRIRSRPIGKGLLKTIAAKCLMSGKSVFIDYYQASLAGVQGDVTEAYGYQKMDDEGRVFFMPGNGQSASVSWWPDDPGPPYAERPAFVGLAHELIHALHIVHGQQIADTNSTQGLAINEAQVVGLGRFKDEPFTENAIRDEHGITLRTQYLKEGTDFAKDPVVTGARPLPVYTGSGQRP